MKFRYGLVLAGALCLGTGGCRVVKSLIAEEQPDAAPVVPAVPSATALAAAPAAPSLTPSVAEPAQLADDRIPAVVDFEEEAFERVTKETVKVRVDDLARAIKGE